MKLIISIIMFLLSSCLLAQEINPQNTLPFQNETPKPKAITFNCAFDLQQEEKRKNIDFRNEENFINNKIKAAKLSPGDTLTIPVVLHIIHNVPSSISDAFIISKISDLNDAFSKSGAYSASSGVDTKIRFCLAQKDPDGGSTNGITRNTSFFSNNLNTPIEDDKLKNLIQWPPADYVNIWYIQSLQFFITEEFACGVWTSTKAGGYATLPPGGGSGDGIVITGFGPLLAHEMGHYLGLYHTFEGGCSNFDCTTNGDRVCDTPPDDSKQSIGCGSTMNSCFTDANSGFTNDTIDYTKNFMDYGNQSCMNQFTQGQADRMRNAINIIRTGLLINKCDKPCAENSNAYFTKSIDYPVIGNNVTFTNASTNATNYQWYVDGVLQSSATNFNYTFANVGKFKISLRAFNADANCYANYIAYVIVNCGVTARFYPDKTKVASKLPLYPNSILFNNTTTGALTYEWWISNSIGMPPTMVSTATNLNYIFPDPAIYKVKLIAYNGTCIDSTLEQTITVLDPTPDGYVYLNSLLCYQDSGLRMQIVVCNNGYATLPANMPISFYETNPLSPGATKLPTTYYTPLPVPGKCCVIMGFHNVFYNHTGGKQLYISFNDTGAIATPIIQPNNSFQELTYSNNITSYFNKYTVFITPATVTTALPTAIVPLTASANQPTSNFTWSPALNLSCTVCATTFLTIDSNRIKTVIAKSSLGCYDTTKINIIVPPSDDFKVQITNAFCVNQDSIQVQFKITNSFAPGKIHKNLRVAFYNGNPLLGGTQLLPPLFDVPTTIAATTASYNIKIKNMPAGNLYAVVNDSALVIPVNLPSTPFVEANYINNISQYAYDPRTYKNFTQTICEGQSFLGYSTTGVYLTTYTNSNGCDSLRTVNLTVNPRTYETLNINICQGQTYLGYNITGTYKDTLVNQYGCDSVRTLNLKVNLPSFRTINDTICEGSSSYGYTTSGTYVDVFVNAVNCDSTRTLNLVVKPKKYSSITATICEGDTLEGYYLTGIYNPIFLSSIGCDSIRTITLTVLPTKRTNVTIEICEQQQYFVQGAMQTVSGLYYDTLLSSYNCDSVIITNLIVHPLPQPNLGNDTSICFGTSVTFNAGIFINYLWQDGTMNQSFTTSAAGNYYITVTDINNCEQTDSVKVISILPLPKNFLPPQDKYCRGNGYVITIPNFIKYLWSNGSTTNTLDVNSFGKFYLTATDKFGCVGKDSILLQNANCRLYIIPNAFTPNDDNLNDNIKPIITQRVTNYSFRIFNRWGQLMFLTNDRFKAWDGKFNGTEQALGTYVYQISFTDFDKEAHSYKGTIILTR